LRCGTFTVSRRHVGQISKWALEKTDPLELTPEKISKLGG